ncbi:MFS transporter, partial [Acinetobacter baumannii]
MRKILGIASLIMSTGVVHAEQLNEQDSVHDKFHRTLILS